MKLIEKDGILYYETKKNILKVAGRRREDGYQCVRYKSKHSYRHRVIWEMYNGPIPSGMMIDHINGIPGDDRIENLQLVTASENVSLGAGSLLANNRSGVHGVSWHAANKLWVASFKYQGIRYHVGYFKDLSEAKTAIDLKRNSIGAPQSRRTLKDET